MNLKLSQISQLLNAMVLTPNTSLNQSVHSVFCSDLMSDVLAYSKDSSILVTGLCNPQIIRTAQMMDLICIIIGRGKLPDEFMIELAEENQICLMSCPLPIFDICAQLAASGLGGGYSNVS